MYESNDSRRRYRTPQCYGTPSQRFIKHYSDALLGVNLDMGIAAHLIPSADRKGKFSGYYKCSLCDAEFRPNPKDRGELPRTFVAHVQFSHTAKTTQGNDPRPTRQMYRKRI